MKLLDAQVRMTDCIDDLIREKHAFTADINALKSKLEAVVDDTAHVKKLKAQLFMTLQEVNANIPSA